MAPTVFPLTRETFNAAYSWEVYLARMRDHRAISTRLYDEAEIPSEIVEGFKALVARRGGRISISAMTEEWCGDSAVTLPFVARLAEKIPGIELRILIGRKYPEIRDAYRDDGFRSVPLLSFFDANWSEIGRWMERPQAAHLRVRAWIAERPRIAELTGKQEPAAKRELKGIFAELVTEMADWYRKELWKDIVSEIRSALS